MIGSHLDTFNPGGCFTGKQLHLIQHDRRGDRCILRGLEIRHELEDLLHPEPGSLAKILQKFFSFLLYRNPLSLPDRADGIARHSKRPGRGADALTLGRHPDDRGINARPVPVQPLAGEFPRLRKAFVRLLNLRKKRKSGGGELRGRRLLHQTGALSHHATRSRGRRPIRRASSQATAAGSGMSAREPTR